MLAKMCILETIPGAFDSYIPPTGMNVAWYWDFKGKENENQVVGFFTTQEISLNENEILPEGSIKKEVANNRCFVLIKVVPEKDWPKIIKDFHYGGQQMIIAKDHPSFKEEWRPKQKKRILKAADGSQTEEILEFESEVDEEVLNQLNSLRDEQDMHIIQPEESKIRKIKSEGDKKPRYMVKMEFVKVIDEIREEKI
jgi:hypothetical protein